MKEQFHKYIINLYNNIPDEVYVVLLTLFLVGTAIILTFKGFNKGWRYSSALLLIEYIFLIYGVTVLFRNTIEPRGHNFTPFWSYEAIMDQKFLVMENIMNVVVFIPVGLLLGALLRVKGSWLLTLLIGMGISISIETLQYVFKLGFAETDDVIHNSLGCLIGWLLCQAFYSLYKKTRVVQDTWMFPQRKVC